MLAGLMCCNVSGIMVPATPHSFLCGMRAARATSSYVLQLDDDIIVPPNLLQQLVDRMQRDPTAWMVTGYPFDVPSFNSTLAAYCVLVYHLPLLIAFSIRSVRCCVSMCPRAVVVDGAP